MKYEQKLLCRIRNRLRVVLACLLAIILTAGYLAPARPVYAKADMKINLDSKILYLGESAMSKTKSEYDFYIKNKPSNYKKIFNFYWTSSQRKVATVSNAGLVKAVSVGTTTISCTITDKETGDIVSETSAKVTVKQNARIVTISGCPENNTATVGEVVNFNRTMIPKTGEDGVTDKTRWVLTENTAGATVTQSNGKVTATEPGSYTITAYTYQSASYPLQKDKNGNYTGYTAMSQPITITVVDGEESIGGAESPEEPGADIEADSVDPESNQTTEPEPDYAELLAELVNVEREKEGLLPLAIDASVQEVANLRAKEIAVLFAHTRPDGQTCFAAIDEADISYKGLGENIAYGYATPEAVMEGWMNSEGHKANILYDTFDGIGVGYYVEDDRAYWVQMFIAY